MTGSIYGTTKNFGLLLINFNTGPWHDLEYSNLRTIDAVLANYLSVENIKGTWANSVSVVAGDRYIDGDDGTIWEVLISHTTAGLPTTFAQDRVARPTYWLGVSGATRAEAAAAAALASQNAAATSEANALSSENASAASASSANSSAINAAASASDALASENNAATSETNAAISETNAAASAAAAATHVASVKVSSTDTTPGWLLDKLTPGTGLSLVQINTGGNEQLQITTNGSSIGSITSSTNVVMTLTSPQILSVTISPLGAKVILPDLTSAAAAVSFVIYNAGVNPFDVEDAAGNFIRTVNTLGYIAVVSRVVGTAAGEWVITSEDRCIAARRLAGTVINTIPAFINKDQIVWDSNDLYVVVYSTSGSNTVYLHTIDASNPALILVSSATTITLSGPVLVAPKITKLTTGYYVLSVASGSPSFEIRYYSINVVAHSNISVGSYTNTFTNPNDVNAYRIDDTHALIVYVTGSPNAGYYGIVTRSGNTLTTTTIFAPFGGTYYSGGPQKGVIVTQGGQVKFYFLCRPGTSNTQLATEKYTLTTSSITLSATTPPISVEGFIPGVSSLSVNYNYAAIGNGDSVWSIDVSGYKSVPLYLGPGLVAGTANIHPKEIIGHWSADANVNYAAQTFFDDIFIEFLGNNPISIAPARYYNHRTVTRHTPRPLANSVFQYTPAVIGKSRNKGIIVYRDQPTTYLVVTSLEVGPL